MARGRVTLGRRRPAALPGDPNQYVTVATKALWSAGRWIVSPYLYPVQASTVLPPAVCTATMEYEYGELLRPGSSASAIYEPLDILDHYARIQIFASVPDADSRARQVPLGVWHGIIVSEDRLPDAAASDVEKQGRQRFTAYGLEHLLRKAPIDTTAAMNWMTGEVIRNRVRTVFNGSILTGRRMQNLYVGLGTDQPAFSAIESAATGEWDLRSIAQYLLTWYANQRLAMEFKLGTVPEGVESIKPIVDLFDASVFEALNELFSPSRGLGWHLEVAPLGGAGRRPGGRPAKRRGRAARAHLADQIGDGGQRDRAG